MGVEMNILKEIVDNCTEIESARNYWFVRTDGGRLYESFLTQGIIAIGYSEINLEDIYVDGATHEAIKNSLLLKVKETYPKHKVPGLVVSQIFRFVYEIKMGDVVVVPSAASDHLTIGIVKSEHVTHSKIYVQTGDFREIDHNFQKVKPIRWVKQFSKFAYNPKLFQMFSSHQAIFQVNDYAPWIDPMLYDFFKKEGKYHLRLNLKKDDGIKFRELFSTCLALLDSSDELLSDLKIFEDTSEIESRINLNSPGDIDLISKGPYIVIMIALIVIFFNGGGLKFSIKKFGFDFDLNAGSFIERLNNLLNSSQDRKLKKVLAQQLDNLQIADSQEVIAILEKINERNQNG